MKISAVSSQLPSALVLAGSHPAHRPVPCDVRTDGVRFGCLGGPSERTKSTIYVELTVGFLGQIWTIRI
jgi:hypothetical protein